MLEADVKDVKEGEDKGTTAVDFKHWSALKTATAENSGQDETSQVSPRSINYQQFQVFSVSFLCPFYFFQFD